MSEIFLVFPPHWIPDYPYLSTPCLTAFLRQKGYTVEQMDANVLAHDFFLSKEYLQSCAEKLGNENLKKGGIFFNKIYEKLIETVENTKKEIRSSEEDLEEKFSLLSLCYGLISHAYHPTLVSRSVFEMKYCNKKSADVAAAAQDEKNPFIHIMNQRIIPQILRSNPQVVGISIVSPYQLIPGITLARLLSQENPALHITVGGNLLSRLWKFPHRLAPLFQFIDSVVVFEGETALESLAESILEDRPLRDVPNLIFKENHRIIVNEFVEEDLSSLPTPDFGGLDFEKYFLPFRVLPVYSSRGCYWNRCAFCTIPYGYGENYKERNLEKVAEDIKILKKEKNTTYFEFIDECIHASNLDRLSRLFISENIDIRWMVEIRAEESINENLLRKMYESGCRILYMGLESGCQRTLNAMRKGVFLKDVSRILKKSSEIGFWNHVFVMFGFPGETIKEAMETINFVSNHRPWLNSVNVNTFILFEDSYLSQNSEKYDVVTFSTDNDLSLSPTYKASGMNQKETEEVRKHMVEVCSKLKLSLPYWKRWIAPKVEGYIE